MNINRFLDATELFFFYHVMCGKKYSLFFFKKIIFYKDLNYIMCLGTGICRVEFYLFNKIMRARGGCHRKLSIKRKFY